MTTTPTDPAAIDLHAVGSRNCDLSASITELREDGAALIAAVEALREQLGEAVAMEAEALAGHDQQKAEVEALQEDVAGYDTARDLARERERPWIEKWRIASGKPKSLPDYGEMLGWTFGQIEAAEAREAVLAGALEPLTQWVANSKGEHGDDFLNEDGWDDLDQLDAAARAALATTPAQAMERARAVEAVLKWARLVCCEGMVAAPGPHFRWPDEYYALFNNLGLRLANLDALGKEG